MSHYQEFKTSDRHKITALMKRFSFGVIVKNNLETGYPDHIEIPVILSACGSRFEFHIAKAHQAYENFSAGGKVSAVFIGPNAHISPSFYKNKDRTQTAPTWNYVRIALKGEIAPMDEVQLHHHLERLVNTFEATVEDSWALEALDENLFGKWTKFISGFSLDTTEMECIEKLSQDKVGDQENIIKGLKKRNIAFDNVLAEYMQSFYLEN